jgi:hypothetical protein
MDSYFGATRPYYKCCRSCALCYDENYNNKNIKLPENIQSVYLKMLVDNVISKLINMLKDVVY